MVSLRMEPGALSMSLSEPSMSVPDLTMSMSDPTSGSPLWTSDIEGEDRTRIVDRQAFVYRYKGRRRNPYSSANLLGRSLSSDIALGRQAGDMYSVEGTSSNVDTSLGFLTKSSRGNVKSPTLTTQGDSLESSMDSYASSGVPGFGYYSGKALKWLGERSLDAVDSLIILRRTYSHLARLKRWRKQGKAVISAQQQQKMFTMLEDALEMSRPCYSYIVNKAAAVIARAVDDWITDHFAGTNTKEVDVWLSQVHCWFDDRRLARSSVHGPRPPDELSLELRKAVTRVPLNFQDTETTSTVITLLARELARSPYESHHRWLAESLRRIVKQIQQTRPLTVEEMIALRNIATRRLEREEAGNGTCRPWEVVLFAECASQSVWCTDIVRGPQGLPSLVNSLEIAVARPVMFAHDAEWENLDDLLASLLSLSRYGWLEGSFAAIPGLGDLLLRMLRHGTRERRFRSCTCIIFTLRNLNTRQFMALHTPEAGSALAALAAAPMRRGLSSEEYYRKLACGYARELLRDAGHSYAWASGFTSETEG